MAPPPRSRSFCVTYNADTLPSKDTLRDTLEDLIPETVRYFIAGEECAPTTGRHHLQIYLQFNTQKTVSACKTFLSSVGLSRAHVEIARAGHIDNINYCRKEDTDALELGNPIGQGTGGGRREQHANLAQRIRDRDIKTVRDAMLADPIRFSIHASGMTKLIQELATPRRLDDMPTIIWRFGETGTGKSEWCQNQLDSLEDPHLCYTYSSGQDGWFDGYGGQPYVIMQELRAHDFRPSVLLQLFDKYQCRIKIKGGFVDVLAHTFWVTSPVHPRALFPNAFKQNEGKADQLKRRITEIWHHRKDLEPVRVNWDWDKDTTEKRVRSLDFDFEDDDNNPFRQD